MECVKFSQQATMKHLEAQVGYLVTQMNQLLPNNKIKIGIEQSSGFLNLVQVFEGGTISRIVSGDSKRDMQNILTALQNYTTMLVNYIHDNNLWVKKDPNVE